MSALEEEINRRVAQRMEEMLQRREKILEKNKQPLPDDNPHKIWGTICGEPVTGPEGKRLMESLGELNKRGLHPQC